MKLIKLTFLSVGMISMILACRKVNPVEPNVRANSLRTSNCQIEASTACGGTMLSFPSLQAYDNAYQCLFEEYETWNDSFDLANSNLNDDDLNDLIESIGWDEEQTLIDFETSQGYNSLRSKLRTDEIAWLATGTFDPATDPNNHFVDDPVEQALLNENGMIMIAGEIIIYNPDGSIYKVTNGDCELALSVAADPSSASGPNVVVVASSHSGNDECVTHEKNDSDVVWSGDPNKMYSWYLKFKQGYSQSIASAQIVNFRRKNNTSNWKKFRTMCDVEVSGNSRNADSCGREEPFTVGCPPVLLTQNYCAPKKRIRRTGKTKLNAFKKIKRLDVGGYYEAGGTVTRRFLNW